MAKTYKLTKERKEELKEELEYLRTVREREVAGLIKEARAFGDLSENSEYDEAKNEQAKVENRILELEAMLKNAKVIDEDELTTDTVNVGSRIKVLDVEFNEKVTYHLVGSAEADPKSGRISDESPIGKALIGHKKGDTVTVDAPAGELLFKVLEISR